MFVTKKIITLTTFQMMSNKKQKNFRDKTKTFLDINANKMHFELIIKEI